MSLKNNVNEFNNDVAVNGGYRYTQNAPFSSIVSNRRINDEIERILRQTGNIRTAIDMGCGDGTHTAEMKRRIPHIQFTGFDPADAAIAHASARYPDCKFCVGDILAADTIPSGPYDVAVIRGVIHHLPTQTEALRNAASIAKRIIIIEPNGNNPILKWIEKHSAYHIQHEEQSFTTSFLKRICAENGLRVARLTFIGFVPFFFPTVLARTIYFLQPLLEKVPLLGRFFGAQTVILATR